MKKDTTPATAYVILETRWPNTKQIYKLKLMVTHKRVQKFYTIIIPGVPASMSEKDFAKIKLKTPRKPFSDYKDLIAQVEIDARKVITGLPEFSFEAFEKNYFEPSTDDKSLFAAIEAYMAELTQQGSVGTASSYKCALVSLKKFTAENGINSISFNDVTTQFLNDWEAWMKQKETALATIGIYCRNVRTIFNKAIDAGLVKHEDYPFGRNKFIPPTGQNIKKALTVAEVGKIFNYNVAPDSPEHRARDLWVFSYLCNGINIKDIARLKYKNIDYESINFIRAKTQRSQRSNQKNISVPLSKEVSDIIEKWGNKPALPDSHVFPILYDGVNPARERVLVQQATKTTNKYVKRIAKSIGIQSVTTTYTARHSFATVMKRSGASTEFISESLGHSNLATTENYLASFEMETKRKLAKNLLKF